MGGREGEGRERQSQRVLDFSCCTMHHNTLESPFRKVYLFIREMPWYLEMTFTQLVCSKLKLMTLMKDIVNCNQTNKMTELTHYLTLAIRLHKHCTVKSYQKHAFTRTKVFAPYAGSRFSLSLAFTVRKSGTSATYYDWKWKKLKIRLTTTGGERQNDKAWNEALPPIFPSSNKNWSVERSCTF